MFWAMCSIVLISSIAFYLLGFKAGVDYAANELQGVIKPNASKKTNKKNG